MKRKYQIIIACLTVGFISSCSKFLDVKPKDSILPDEYFETEIQLNKALIGVYDVLGSSALYGNYMHGRMGLDADEGFQRSSTLVTGPITYDVEAADLTVQNFWAALYDGINRANFLLENIHRPKMDETKRNEIKGQVLFLRGYYYFLLVANFGDVPLITTATKSIGNTQIARTPSKQVYEQIEKDMLAAEPLVKSATEVGFGGKINKSAVWGILAKVYLYWAGYPLRDQTKYEEARKWSLKVITSGEHTLNPSYQQIFINYAQDKYDIKESIWEVEFWGNDAEAYVESGRVGSVLGIANSTDDPVVGRVLGYINATATLYRRYEDTDLRRDWAIGPFRYSGTPPAKINYSATQIYQRNAGKWRREYEVVSPKSIISTPQNYPLLRYSDVLLMYAEAETEVSGTPNAAAYNAINQVRRRAYGKEINTPNATVDFSGMGKASFLSALQDERSRELAFESIRKGDLVRWGLLVNKMKTVEADFGKDIVPDNLKHGAKTFKSASARDVVFPIPAYEMSLNRLLIQNYGW